MPQQHGDSRRARRSRSYAKLTVRETGAVGYLRDISPCGCLLGFLAPLPVQRGDLLRLHILADPEVGIPPFELQVRVAWTRSDPVYFTVGATADPAAPGEGGGRQQRCLEALVAYYAA